MSVMLLFIVIMGINGKYPIRGVSHFGFMLYARTKSGSFSSWLPLSNPHLAWVKSDTSQLFYLLQYSASECTFIMCHIFLSQLPHVLPAAGTL